MNLSPKRAAIFLFFALIPLLSFAQKGGGGSAPAPDKKTADLTTLVEKVNESLARAAADLSKEKIGVKITEAEVKFETTHVNSAGGGFKVVLKASHEWEQKNTSAMTFSFKAEELLATNEILLKKLTPSFEQVLYSAIVQAAREFHNTSSTITGLVPDAFEIEIAFSITRTSDGGLEFEIWGIGFDGSASHSKEVVHTISLKFKAEK